MKNFTLYIFVFCVFLFYSQFSKGAPNIIIILTDDLGWGDVSYNGGPISTPNIDKLSNNGVQMNRFYSAPTCSPTRAALLTGINSLAVGVIRPIDNPTADRYGLPLKYKIMPQFFKDAGYQTALSGKWHLGMFSDEYLPRNRGFDSTYGHLGGGILQGFLSILRASCAILGLSWGILETSQGAQPGNVHFSHRVPWFRRFPERSWRRLGRVLGASWARLGCVLARLGSQNHPQHKSASRSSGAAGHPPFARAVQYDISYPAEPT